MAAQPPGHTTRHGVCPRGGAPHPLEGTHSRILTMGKVGRVRRYPGPLSLLAVIATFYATRLWVFWGHLPTYHHTEAGADVVAAAGAAQREETGEHQGPTYPEWAPDADAGTQYLQFLVCMGLCNQVGCQLGSLFCWCWFDFCSPRLALLYCC